MFFLSPPGGRPRTFATIEKAVPAEATSESDLTKAESIVRKLVDMTMQGNLAAIQLMLDREWPVLNRYGIAGADGEAMRISLEMQAAARNCKRS